MNEFETRRAFGFLLADTARIVRKVVDQRARRIDMSRAQWAILATLKRQDGIRQVDLAHHMDLEPITVARLLDRLEAAELVERRADPEDRRARRIFLRPAAGGVLEQIVAIGDEIMGGVLAGIPASDIETTARVLGRMRDNLQGRQGGCGNSDNDDAGQVEHGSRRAARQLA